MNIKLVKLKFTTPIHYGNFGKPGLLNSDRYVASDTLYSAFCEIAPNKIEELHNLILQKQVLISDALPYIGKHLLLPKPPQGLKVKKDLEIDRTLYKKMKKVDFVALEDYATLVTDATEELVEKTIELNNKIGAYDERVFNRVSRGLDDTLPFVVSTYQYYEDSGLYILVQYETKEALETIVKLIEDLGYAGVGGKRSSGLGKYEIASIEDFEIVESGKYILVSTSLPIELPQDVYFNTLKRSGFHRLAANFYKKRDVYAIKSGLLLDNPFEGVVLEDLSNQRKVFRFLIPMFVRVKL